VRSVLSALALLLLLYLLIFAKLSLNRAMLTDAPPRKANPSGFLESDQIRTLDLPQDGRLPQSQNPVSRR
jgi:hypothetical protein